MNNQAIGWGIGALVVIGGAAFFILGGTSGSNGAETIEGSMKELIASNRSLSCTFSVQIDGAQSEGRVYVANGKIRTDTAVTVGEKIIESHMISDGETGHSWTSLTSQGIRFKMTAGEESSPQGGISPDQKVTSSCTPWTEDPTLFNLPQNITFMDMSAAGAPSNTALQCGMCDTIPASAKAQCLASIGCSQ